MLLKGQSLSERIRELEAIVSLSADLYFFLSSDDVITHYYAKTPDDLYKSPADFMGKRMSEVLPPEVAKLHQKALKWVLEKQQPTSFDYWLTFNDGKSRAFQGKLCQTDPNTILLVITDITDRKMAEGFAKVTQQLAEAEQSEQKFRRLADEIEAIVGIHKGDRWLYVNRTMERVTGYSREELLGMPFYSLISPESRDLVRRRGMARAQGATIESTYEVPGIRKSGDKIFWSIRPVIIEYEGSPAVLVTGYDITSRRYAEMEIKRAKEMADEANRAKSQFLMNMSHEIRTPMVAILGFSEMMRNPSLTQEERNNCIETISRNGKHLLTLINSILDLSRIEAGDMPVEKHWSILKDEIAQIRDMFRGVCEQSGVNLVVTMDSNLPEKIYTSSMRLRQILINIVGNAVKFTEHGTVSLSVGWCRIGTQPLIQFTVADTGIGIAAEKVTELFRPFTQADQTLSRKFGGTGLGLALARQLARSLGGDVELISSVPNSGSVFSITIDPGQEALLSTGEPLPNASTPSPYSTLASSPMLHNVRVLLVEDSPDCQALFEHILTTSGAHVVAASDGLEALRLGTQPNLDLILMDIQLPSMDGLTVTRAMRKNGVDIPIIALTAHASEEDRKRCLEAGCDDWISKPVECDALVERVSHWVDAHHSSKARSQAT